MPFDPVRSQALHMVQPQRIDPAGKSGPTRDQAKRSRWVRVGPGLHVPAGTDRARPEQRLAELAARYPGAVVSGWGALWLHGAAFFDGLGADGTTRLPLVVILPKRSGRRPSDDVRLSYEPLGVDEVSSIAGLRVASAQRALFDVVRAEADLSEGVVAVDMAAAARLVAPEHLERYASARSAWRRTSRVAPAVTLASELSRSPNETRVRMIWCVDAGLPPVLVNREVFDRSARFVCRADLLDPVAGLVVEYDGSEHRRATRHAKDVARQERCREVGLEYTVVTGPDLRERAMVVDRLRAARARARFPDPTNARWTIVPPDGWSVSPTWADERDQETWLREQLASEARAELSDA